jgi:transposase-like protein
VIPVPWRETCSKEERVRFILACRDSEESFATVCESFGISRKTGYKWLDRYDEHGMTGLVEQSRVPAVHPRWLTDTALDAIIEVRKDHPTWGPKKLQGVLLASHPELAQGRHQHHRRRDQALRPGAQATAAPEDPALQRAARRVRRPQRRLVRGLQGALCAARP